MTVSRCRDLVVEFLALLLAGAGMDIDRVMRLGFLQHFLGDIQGLGALSNECGDMLGIDVEPIRQRHTLDRSEYVIDHALSAHAVGISRVGGRTRRDFGRILVGDDAIEVQVTFFGLVVHDLIDAVFLKLPDQIGGHRHSAILVLFGFQFGAVDGAIIAVGLGRPHLGDCDFGFDQI